MTFDRVHKGDASQTDLYGCCSDIVEAALQGYNACIMTYGQTGAWPPHQQTGSDLSASVRLLSHCTEIHVLEQKLVIANARQSLSLCLDLHAGSGKTHTLVGSLTDVREHGILPMAAQQLCQHIQSSHDGSGRVICSISIAEIYCERVRDLLVPAEAAPPDLQITHVSVHLQSCGRPAGLTLLTQRQLQGSCQKRCDVCRTS